MFSESFYMFFLEVLQLQSKSNVSPFKFKDNILMKNESQRCWMLAPIVFTVNGLVFFGQAYLQYLSNEVQLTFLSVFLGMISILYVIIIFGFQYNAEEFITLTNNLIGFGKAELVDDTFGFKEKEKNLCVIFIRTATLLLACIALLNIVQIELQGIWLRAIYAFLLIFPLQRLHNNAVPMLLVFPASLRRVINLTKSL